MELVNGSYQINGIQVLDLCKKYETPLYVYDTAKMEAQYHMLKASFKDIHMQVNYACKALTNINVLKFFNKLGTGLDTVSIQEVQLGLKAGFKPGDILYTPNCVSLHEIEQAVGYGVRINIDNISILEQFGEKYGHSVPLGVRINPHILGGGNTKISTGHIDSKFGISIYQMAHVHQIIETYNLQVEGLHMHTGSDILDTEVFLSAAEIMMKTAMEFKGLQYIDFGSGFKVQYKPDDVFTNIGELGHELTTRFKTFCQEYGQDLTLIFEPGKFLVSEAGYFLAHVNVIKQTPATVFAGLDTGMNHFIRPMFYDSYHQIINVSRPERGQRVYSVVGYICETDTFGWNRRINEISEGDILCFLNAGAYCYQMSSNYNSRYRPAEILIHDGKDHLIRKRENMDDILRNQVEVDFI